MKDCSNCKHTATKPFEQPCASCIAVGGRACWEPEGPRPTVPKAARQDDPVNHPSHYTQGGIECIDALKAATTGLEGIEAVCTGNAIKYLWRWKYKNGAQDIDKAIWYLERLRKEVNHEAD